MEIDKYGSISYVLDLKAITFQQVCPPGQLLEISKLQVQDYFIFLNMAKE